MEPTINSNLNPVPNPIQNPASYTQVVPQPIIPRWFNVFLSIYGIGSIVSALFLFIFPVLGGFLAVILSEGKESFLTGFMAYKYSIVGVIPSLVLAYGVFKKRKWIISCLIIQLVSSLISLIIFIFNWNPVSSAIAESTSLPILALLNIVPILILVFALKYRTSFTGKYFAIIPTALLILSLGYMQSSKPASLSSTTLPLDKTEKTTTQHTSAKQEIVTKNGTVSFTLGENVGYENWGDPTTNIGLVFVAKEGKSGTLFGGCGAGSSFIEVSEVDANSRDYDYNKDFKLNPRTETFGSNTYHVYDWRVEPSVTYYEIPYNTSKVIIVYRPKEPCVGNANYRPDLETLLKTFNYSGPTKINLTTDAAR